MPNHSVLKTVLMTAFVLMWASSLAGCGGAGSSDSSDNTSTITDTDRNADDGDDSQNPTPDPDPDSNPTPDPDGDSVEDNGEGILPEITYIETDYGHVGPGRIVDDTIQFIGVANPNEVIELTINGVRSGSTVSDIRGEWRLDYRVVSFLPGSYQLLVRSVNMDGRTLEAESSFYFTYDPSPPPTPTVLAITNDSGVVGDGITRDTEQALLGSAGANKSVKVFVDGAFVGNTPSGADGAWQFTFTERFSEGEYQITASSVDYGIESPSSAAYLLLIDQTPPALMARVPRTASIDVPQNTALQIQFSEPVYTNSGQIRIRRLSDDAVVEQFSVSGTGVSGSGSSVIDIEQSGLLALATRYYVEMDAGAFQDAAGNVTAAETGRDSWNFTTEQPLSPTIDATALVPGQGFTVMGAQANGQLGWAVTHAGDMNGDGFQEFALSAPFAGQGAGRVFVLWGRPGLHQSNVTTSSWRAQDGFVIEGAATGDNLGESIAAAGDVNGDGYDDLAVVAPGSDRGASDAGVLFVIWGRPGSTRSDLSLSAFSSSDGFTVISQEAGQRLGDSSAQVDGLSSNGQSLGGGGDFNGDGYADLVVGHRFSDLDGVNAGRAYVILGRAGGSRSDVDLSALGADGLAISHSDGAGGMLGQSAVFAGDFNADGFDDVVLGAIGSDLGAADGGAAYIVYGKPSALFSPMDLKSINANTPNSSLGMQILSDQVGARLGHAVGAGEFNGDGVVDVFLGQHGADGDDTHQGAVHVIYGGSAADISLNVDALPLSKGFSLYGEGVDSAVGHAVSSAGDINADGLDDLLIGAYPKAFGTVQAGQAWVILGSDDASQPSRHLADFRSSDGMALRGGSDVDQLAHSVSAGDFNGDGFSDVLLGAPGYSTQVAGGGLAAMIWGNDWLGDAMFLTGNAAANNIVGSSDNDQLRGNGGADAFSAGAGDDWIEIVDNQFFRIQGGYGTDTLALGSANQLLDLTTIRPEVMNSIEQIDLGDQNNTLKVSTQRVLRLSRQTNRLTVMGGSSDRFDVSPNDQWNKVADVTLNGIDYVHYADGEAEVLVQSSIVQPGVERLRSSQRYRFDTTADGAAVQNAVHNIPVLLRITDASIIDSVQPGAPDIRVVDDDGITRLPYEIERWDTAANVALVWVLVPQVDGNSNEDFITLLYDDVDDGTVDDGQDAATLWSDYAGVWHFADSGDALDSSAFSNHGRASGGVGRVNSFIGRGATFTDDAQLTVPYTVSMDVSGRAFSVESWYTSDTCSTTLFSSRYSLNIMSRGDGSSGFWNLNTAQYLASLIVLGTRIDRASFEVGQGSNRSQIVGGSLFGVFLGNCVEHVIATYDPLQGSKIYINGELRNQSSVRYQLESGQDLILGGHGTNYDLTLDEVRLSRQLFSADRIKLTYANQSEFSNFIHID